MYQEYKDVAEFYIVYIREAHAADSEWPVDYAKGKGINNHTSYGERCEVAELLVREKKLTIPCVIDGMDNQVNDAYRGWPTRVFLVRKDGKLGVAGGRGPWGLRPALKDAAEWLAAYRKTGEEPALPARPPDADKEKKLDSGGQDADEKSGDEAYK
jgi:hypothetical protein